jgi:GT2 family glycosyltransferase
MDNKLDHHTKSLVSVIIPVYNGEEYLELLINSIKTQTYSNIEIIAIDNNSLDNSVKLLKSKYQNEIKIIQNKKNLGYCIASNQGLENSNGEHILFLSQDRIFENDWIEKTVTKMKSDPKIGCVIGKIISKDEEYTEYGISYDIYGGSIVKKSPEEENLFYQGGAILVRKNILDKIGGFDPEFFMYQEDVDLCWRIWLCGFKVKLVKNAISYDNGRIVNSSIIKDKITVDFKDPNLTNMPLYIYYNSFGKNRIRIMLKNYSKLNLIKRLPMTFFIIFLRGLFLSIKTKKISYLSAYFKGIFWNIKNFRNTLQYRKKIQKMRKINDIEIEKHMINYSIELSALKTMMGQIIKK